MDKPKKPRGQARRRGNYNLHPDATERLDAVAPLLPAQSPGLRASLLIMVGAAVVEARPDLVRAASDACLTARDYDPARIGAVVGASVVERLATADLRGSVRGRVGACADVARGGHKTLAEDALAGITREDAEAAGCDERDVVALWGAS